MIVRAAVSAQISSCILISSPSRHSSSLAVLSSGVCTSSSSLLLLKSVLVELAIVTALSLPRLLRLLLLAFFLNQPRRDLVEAASVSEAIEAAYSDDGLASMPPSRLADGLGVGVDGSAESATGSSLGVGMGVTSVDGVTSTSSASRYHFRRRV